MPPRPAMLLKLLISKPMRAAVASARQAPPPAGRRRGRRFGRRWRALPRAPRRYRARPRRAADVEHAIQHEARRPGSVPTSPATPRARRARDRPRARPRSSLISAGELCGRRRPWRADVELADRWSAAVAWPRGRASRCAHKVRAHVAQHQVLRDRHRLDETRLAPVGGNVGEARPHARRRRSAWHQHRRSGSACRRAAHAGNGLGQPIWPLPPTPASAKTLPDAIDRLDIVSATLPSRAGRRMSSSVSNAGPVGISARLSGSEMSRPTISHASLALVATAPAFARPPCRRAARRSRRRSRAPRAACGR